MSKIELSLASDYVPSWTIVDAIRELFQNALDQEAQFPDNKASWSYEDGVFKISNKKSVLTTRTLLLGCSTKASDDRTIGQFGEGYKVATLVLLRNNKAVTMYNYGAREVWRPRFVKSRRFGADILTFFTDKEYVWNKVPNDDLTIEVAGITQEEWDEQIVPSNLWLQKNYGIEDCTEYGDIIDQPGMVYVNGLYVCKYEPYEYGYNFKPGQLKLDRDRKLASDFDLRWLASKMWFGNPRAIGLVEAGIADVSYISSMLWSSGGTAAQIVSDAYNQFRLVHGPRAVPVTTQAEADKVPHGYKAVIVSENYRSLIRSSSDYEEPQSDTPSPLERLRIWFDDTAQDMLTSDACEQFEEIWEELEE